MKNEKEVLRMELAEIRNELEKTAQQIKDFRGSL
ncbi:peptide chain release factor 2 [Listeria rocourtiae FSL F6-920]|nr:peptide chain release factor 2 [Listeria rocourtiae FSL F6-920]